MVNYCKRPSNSSCKWMDWIPEGDEGSNIVGKMSIPRQQPMFTSKISPPPVEWMTGKNGGAGRPDHPPFINSSINLATLAKVRLTN